VFFLPPKLSTTCSIKRFSEKKRVQFFDQVKYLGVLLNASLKDDDDIQRQVKLLYCAANKLRSPAVKTLYFVPITCQYILANGGTNTHRLV